MSMMAALKLATDKLAAELVAVKEEDAWVQVQEPELMETTDPQAKRRATAPSTRTVTVNPWGTPYEMEYTMPTAVETRWKRLVNLKQLVDLHAVSGLMLKQIGDSHDRKIALLEAKLAKLKGMSSVPTSAS